MKKKKKKYFSALAEKYAGSGAVPACPHFGKCGGCMFQNIPYENQLLLKQEYLSTLLEGTVNVGPVHGTEPYGYRNRMDMVCAFGKTGLREAGSYKFVVDVTACPLMQNSMEQVYTETRPFLSQVEGYDYLKHEGCLRYIVLRQAHFTGQVMANLVISSAENMDKITGIIPAIAEKVTSMSVLLSDGLADLSYGSVISHIKQGYIEEDFDGIKYRIGPNTFFQSNSLTAREMYRRIKSHVRGKVLDLYSGVGSITLFAADSCDHITGVEISEESVAAAEINRQINGTANADFICRDAKEHILENRGKYDTLIMDPPRTGIHPKMISCIEEMAPERIIYMSCNPGTFKENMETMTQYRIASFEAFDMFPQTPHVETLAVLERK